MASRLAATNIAARLGVFSNEALVDFYSRLVEDESAPEAATEKAQAMRTAYVGNDVAQRLEAMQRFWFQEGADRPDYATSEERRVGKEGVSTCRSGWSP